MDLDVIHKNVQGLMAFKAKVESLLANAGTDLGAEATASMSDRFKAVEDRLTELEEHVSSIQQAFDDLGPKLQDLPAVLEGVANLQAMAEWFADHREGLEALLSIGDDFAPQQDPASGTANAGAGDTTGTISGAGGTEAPASDAKPSAPAPETAAG